jgi:hypothetical protein
MQKILGGLFFAALAMMLTIACEGPTGPAGPAGGIDTTTVYLGSNATTCGHCHSSKVAGWGGTVHYAAYDSTKAADACAACHTTGWNTSVANGGYDDNHSVALQNVQCEACHGPMGPNPATHQPATDATLSGEACATCHATEYAEWQGAAHADTAATPAALIAEWGSSSCNYCHLTEGYLGLWDAANYTAPNFADGKAHAVTCGACHDAHDNHTVKMVRAQSTITLPNPTGATITGWGKGLSCGNCHRDRRSASQIDGHMNNGSASFGPHGSPQSNMLVGVGSYKIPGMAYTDTASEHTATRLPDMCVDCHMMKTGTAPHYTDRGHTFEPKVAKCAAACHPGVTNFDYNGVQTEIDSLLATLDSLILRNTELVTIEDVGDTSKSTLDERRAAWAWFFVTNDGSHGVHNANYARTLLNNSISYITTYRAGIGDLAAIKAH